MNHPDVDPTEDDTDYDALAAFYTDPTRQMHGCERPLTGAEAAAAGRSIFTADELQELLSPAEFAEWARGQVPLAS